MAADLTETQGTLVTTETTETEGETTPKEATDAMNETNATDVSDTPNVEGTAETMKTMKSIYLEKDDKKDDKKNKSIAYFIGSFKEDDEEFVEIDGNATANASTGTSDILSLIAKSAFAHSDVEKILFKDCSPDIGEKAFEECESLTAVIFGKLGKDETIEQSVLKNLKLASATGDYTIQVNAFKDCAKLATLVLPQVGGTLVIEKDAFCGCRTLRTVVALCDKADFTGNPFADSPEHLTFVCKENSEVARFARENGYRSVYAG
ncbi:MAG: leucine-rich repeat domain-containing protein [Treponemataceae bacterium]|nr:leucine-rich repeat domain-containing protein [Treponemataceae bacterium]